MQKLIPTWRAPKNIHCFTTLRHGGVSRGAFYSFNLGAHVNDDENDVKTNRTLLVNRFHLPQFPLFLTQTHSTNVLELPYHGKQPVADAVYTRRPNQVCLIMTADCLPVLFTNKEGSEVAAVHAGWRGLCDGILEETVRRFQCAPEEIIAWLGPAIGPNAFQVGKEVVEQFVAADCQAESAFRPDPKQVDKYLGNLYQLAAQRLNHLGVVEIFGGKHCTFSESDKFFSYRRDGVTGRMATLIWFTELP